MLIQGHPLAYSATNDARSFVNLLHSATEQLSSEQNLVLQSEDALQLPTQLPFNAEQKTLRSAEVCHRIAIIFRTIEKGRDGFNSFMRYATHSNYPECHSGNSNEHFITNHSSQNLVRATTGHLDHHYAGSFVFGDKLHILGRLGAITVPECNSL